jgi:hypothetical protein
MRAFRLTAWGLLAALAAAGCAQNGPPKAETAAPTGPVAATPPAPPEPAVTLQVVKWPELEKAIAAHKGKVVVLDVWAEY